MTGFILLVSETRSAAQPRVKLTRLRLWEFGAVFAPFGRGKIGLRLQNRRDSLRHSHVCDPWNPR